MDHNLASPRQGKNETSVEGSHRLRHTSDTTSITSSMGPDAQDKRKAKQLLEDVLQSRRSLELFKIVIYQLIPLIVLVVMCSILLTQATQDHANARLLEKIYFSNEQISILVSSLQIERGLSASYLSSNKTHHNLFAELQVERRKTDFSYGSISNWPDDIFDRVRLQEAIWHHRWKVDKKEADTSFNENIIFYTNITKKLINSVITKLKNVESGALYQLVAIESLLLSTDLFGVERALGSVYYIRCQLSPTDLQWFTTVRSQGELMLQQAINYYDQLETEYYKQLNQTEAMSDVENMRREISHNGDACAIYNPAEVEDKTLQWFRNSSFIINILQSVRYEIGEQVKVYAKRVIRTSDNNIIIFTLMTCVGIAVGLVLSVFHGLSSHRMLSSIGHYAKDLKQKTADLATEKKLSQRLLYQMIPKYVAEQLQAGKTTDAVMFDAVTVYFSDIEGFTNISSRSSPIQIVHILNILYSICDECIDKHVVYKVETIGDAYMVASGVPEPTPRHAWEIASMALDIVNATTKCAIPHLPGEHIRIQIGIHTGPCAAGVVGLKMPRYCLFGDTVNIASRMESTGKAMKIHLSAAAKSALELDHEGKYFIVTSRGEVDVKGKGIMTTYWLEGISSPQGNKRQVGWANQDDRSPDLGLPPVVSPENAAHSLASIRSSLINGSRPSS